MIKWIRCYSVIHFNTASNTSCFRQNNSWLHWIRLKLNKSLTRGILMFPFIPRQISNMQKRPRFSGCFCQEKLMMIIMIEHDNYGRASQDFFFFFCPYLNLSPVKALPFLNVWNWQFSWITRLILRIEILGVVFFSLFSFFFFFFLQRSTQQMGW